jgi:hypothetical protein
MDTKLNLLEIAHTALSGSGEYALLAPSVKA